MAASIKPASQVQDKSHEKHNYDRRRTRKPKAKVVTENLNVNGKQTSASVSHQVRRESIPECLSLEDAVLMVSGSRAMEAIAALQRMASGEGVGRQAVVEGGAVEAICAALRPAAVDVWEVPGDMNEMVQMSLSEHTADGDEEDEEKSVASLEVLGTDRALWDVCMALLSRLCLFESEACRRIVDCHGLDLLAMAARAGEPRSTRLKALAALAAVGVWSGPHKAVEIVSTPFLVETMCIALKSSQSLPGHLQGAIYDALVAMAHRHRAREVMKSKGCDSTFRTIAVQASANGDYATAGRASVAAGHLSGHSIDEFGFLVENSSSRSTIDLEDALFTSPPANSSRFIDDKPKDEPFSKSPDINKLRHIVCAMPPVSLGPAVVHDRNVTVARVIDWNEADSGQSTNTKSDEIRRLQDTPATESSTGTDAIPAKRDRIPVNIAVDESDEDPDADNDSPREARKKSRGLSPLQLFSQSAKNGIDGDFSTLKRKSESQISRDHEAASIWTNALNKGRNQLERTKGVNSRVKGYKKLVTVPIPPHMRYKVWALLLDVAELRNQKPGLYADLKSRGEESLSLDSRHTIDVDVVRTMPSHALFWAGGAAMGVDSLRFVLRAYAAYAPDVGYCQGMSSIAALLLMNSKDEEEAFLMLVRFMDRFSYKKVFYPGFPQMQQWIQELQPLCEHYCPALMRHLASENVIPELYMDKWLITALTHNFPHRHVLRIWDAMFLGGSPKIILKSCLGILQEGASKLSGMRFEEMMPFLQKTFADPDEGVLDVTDPEPFLLLIRRFRFKPIAEMTPVATPSGDALTRVSRRHRIRAWFSSCLRGKDKRR